MSDDLSTRLEYFKTYYLPWIIIVLIITLILIVVYHYKYGELRSEEKKITKENEKNLLKYTSMSNI